MPIDDIFRYEASIKFVSFFVLLLIILVAEYRWPKRNIPLNSVRKWVNVGLGGLNTLVLRLCFPVLAVQFAQLIEQQKLGLLNQAIFSISLDNIVIYLLKVLFAMVLLDLIIYWQHRLFHQINWFWRLHRVHHTDIEFDVTTAIRFHPLEIILSMLIKMLSIGLLGAPAVAVLLFEIVLSLGALFTHANIRLHPGLEKIIRRIVVTPDMHRIHHSVLPSETNSNYGFNLVIWDRLFKTYCDQPSHMPEIMPIGLENYRSEAHLTLPKLLNNPFNKK